jgi:hypothetical protein
LVLGEYFVIEISKVVTPEQIHIMETDLSVKKESTGQQMLAPW